MKLVALKYLKFSGKEFRRGDVFETENTYGRILINRRVASLYSEPPQEKPKRSYNRRDMTAEEPSKNFE